MTSQPSQWIRIKSEELTAEIDPLGAQLSILRDRAGRDLLWNGEASVWAGRAPILFPIVGALAGGIYRLGAESCSLPRHGFARGSAFESLRPTETGAAFVLRASEATRSVYPFEFELEVQFELDAATLMVRSLVRNRGQGNLPASLGYHPAFRWPLPYGNDRASHFLEFVSEEPGAVRRLDGAGLLTPDQHPTPVSGRRLALRDSLFTNDAVIFDGLSSRSLSYGAENGPRLRIGLFDAPYLGVWTKPGANFICIEPWNGVADPQGYAGDFRNKPGVFSVAPGAERIVEMSITLSPR
jgi:galactose mutarotase-like enzyme